jgi:acetyl esterase/lipase
MRVREVMDAFLGGPPDAVPERYRDASPMTYVSGRHPPTLLVYGSRDSAIERHFPSRMVGHIRGSGTTVALLEIPWAEHAFDAVPGGLSAQLALYHVERFIAWAVSDR